MNKIGFRLSTALLGYFVLIILFLTLNPFYLTLPKRFNISFYFDLGDFIINILLFLPVGFLYRLSTRQRGAFLLGAAISICIEITQLFIPVRTSSAIDLLANTLGAGLGAMAHDMISTRLAITQGTIGRLRLETPLMGFLYTLTPLLFVDSLSLDTSSYRRILTLLLGVCGAVIISEVFCHWWEKTVYRTAGYASLATGVWFFIGISPTFHHIIPLLPIVLGIVFTTTAWTVFHTSSQERRFERVALRNIFPIFILYLILLALWDPFRSLTTWHWSLGFTDQVTETEYFALAHRIEYLVAFTVLGYLFAEWFGRLEIPLARDLPRLFLFSAGVGLALEFVVGFQIGPGASLIRLILAIASAVFGGIIYHLLRAHIRFLLNH